MSSFKEGWYVIYTKPRHEKKVAAKLTETGVTNYLPTVKQMKKWQDQNKYVDMPLFPSYVFIRLTDMQEYYAGLDTDGVLNYVRIGKQIARVGETVVNNIKLLTTQLNEVEVFSTHFHPGQQLVISHGALTGLSCEIVEFNDRKKVLVRIDMLQRNILVTLPPEYLIAI